MATIDQLLAQLTAEKAVIDSIATAFNTQKQQLDAALANASPVLAAKVDAAFTQAVINNAALRAELANIAPPAP